MSCLILTHPSDKFGTLGPVVGRLRFVVTILSLVDLAALIPGWVHYGLTNSASLAITAVNRT